MIDDSIALLEENIARLERELESAHGILEAANSIIIRCNQDGVIRYINEFGSRFFGYAAGELLGRNVMTIVPEVEQSSGRDLVTLVKDILSHPERHKLVPNENITRDGRTVWVTWANEAIRDEQGAVREILAIGNDITALKEAEQELKEVLQFNELIIDNSPIGLLAFKESGPCVRSNPAAETITGASRDQLLQLNYREMESYRKTGILSDMQEALRTGRVIQNEVHVSNSFGKEIWIEGIISSLEIDQEKHILFLFHDMMERKRLQQSLVRAKEQWEETFDAISDWVSIIDENHQIIRSNTACTSITNQPVQQVIGQRCHDLLHGIACPAANCPGQRAFLSKQRENMEIQSADGRWLWVTVEPISGDYSDSGHYVHIVRDVTAMKQQEKELIAARKAEAFSILSGGIAHDYNNLLAIIWGNLSMAMANIDNATALELLESAETACKSARELTHQFITLSEGAELHKATTDINDALTAALDCVGPKDHLEVTVDKLTDHCLVAADANLLTFALKSIVINAVEAMPGGGKLQVTMEAVARENRDTASDLKLTFADTGKGIPPTDLGKVFDPYFSTKEMGTQKGMGLGLAVCQSIIKKHGGQVHIDSTPGQGTAVAISLPSVKRASLVKNLPEDLTQPVVLLMEDDSVLRKTVNRMLECLNCEVLTAAHGQEAIEVYREAERSKRSIDLVFLDQTIKAGMGGIETLRELRKLDFTNKAVVISGSPNSPAITNFREYGFDDTLVKPFAMEEMEAILSRHSPAQNEN